MARSGAPIFASSSLWRWEARVDEIASEISGEKTPREVGVHTQVCSSGAVAASIYGVHRRLLFNLGWCYPQPWESLRALVLCSP